MSREQQIEVVCLSEFNAGKPAPEEIAMISAMLPELIKLMHEIDDHPEEA